MNKRDDGGPAFPGGWENDSDLNLTAPDGRVIPPMTMHYMSGMSLRDYFAAKAMPVLLAANLGSPTKVSVWAYEQADEMLKARQA